MLSFRDEQVRALGGAVLTVFKKTLAAEIEAQHSMTSEEATKIAQLGADHSVGYGLASPSEIRRYVALMFVLGKRFDADDAHPWAAFILEHPQLLPSVKLDLLEAKARAVATPAP
ncbi:MAG: hypothetical protein K0V04_09995 [Deltaproteobacteria bacterium]|nr:hypothetical protein [Deltaproteobacteria bacterium]